MRHILITTKDESGSAYSLWGTARDKGLWTPHGIHLKTTIEDDGEAVGDALLLCELTGNISTLAAEAEGWAQAHHEGERFIVAHDSGVYKEIRHLDGHNGLRVVGFTHALADATYSAVRSFIEKPGAGTLEALGAALRRPPEREVTLTLLHHDINHLVVAFSNAVQDWVGGGCTPELWHELGLAGKARAFASGGQSALSAARRLLYVDSSDNDKCFVTLVRQTLPNLSEGSRSNVEFWLEMVKALLPMRLGQPLPDTADHEVQQARDLAARALALVERMSKARSDDAVQSIAAEVCPSNPIACWLGQLSQNLGCICNAAR